jgi:hypothetical protein
MMKRMVLAALAVLALAGGAIGLMRVDAGGQDDGICPDFTSDKVVLVADILHVVSKYHTGDPAADLTSDGIVLVDDILTVVRSYREVCSFPTPLATAYDFSQAGGGIPPGYTSHQQFAGDWLDDHQLNHSNGGEAAQQGEGVTWINAGCAVSSEPDCAVSESSTITIHTDGSVDVVVP